MGEEGERQGIGEEGEERGRNRRRVREEIKADIQFALSYFLLFDAATLSSHAKPPSDAPHDVVPVHMSFVDWVPAICSTRTSSSVPLSALHSSSYQITSHTIPLRNHPSSHSPPQRDSIAPLKETSRYTLSLFSLRSKTLTTSRIPSSFPPR
jgi:hypothetical protein